MSDRPTIVFMGTPEFAVPSLEALIRSPYQVVGVVSQPDRPVGRKQVLTPPPVKSCAIAHGIPVIQPERLRSPEATAQVAAWAPDCIVVVAYGQILRPAILGLPPKKCINVHGSLLPAYRGAAPIQWAIANGEAQTGITTMLMDEGMDTGPMLLKREIAIAHDDTTATLAPRLAHLGADLLIETLEKWFASELTPIPQDSTQATLAPLLKKDDSIIDWSLPATVIDTRMRAFSPWPGAVTGWDGRSLKILKAMPSDAFPSDQEPGTIILISDEELVVQTGQGQLLIEELQLAGGKAMKAREFALGYSVQGTRFQTPVI